MTELTGKYLGATEIARLVGVHHTTVTRWINKGMLKAYSTLGGRNRVKLDDLVELVRENNLPFPDELLATEKARVLVVDDDESVLNVLVQGLKKSEEEFTVETATDGFQAGQFIEKFHPHIVVLDIRLPGLNGYDVCRMIKQGHPDTKIIAITGFGSEEVKREIMEAGADGYLEKSFEINELIEEIESVLEKDKYING